MLKSRRGARESLLALRRHPLTWVLLASAVLRIITVAGNSVSLGYSDSTQYVQMAQGIEGNGVTPPGYPLFMRFVHLFSDSVDLLLLAQHALVLLGAVAVYAAARQLRATVLTATLGAAVFAFCGNLFGSAQGILTETLFTVLIAISAWAAAHAAAADRDAGTHVRALAVLGAVVGLAITVRVVGIPLLGVYGLVLLVVAASWAARLRIVATLAVSAFATVALIALIAGSTGGLPGAGTSSSGWMLYGRVAQFADCPATYAPVEVRRFCPKEPEAVRPGPDYWHHYGGPAVEAFGGKPRGNEQLQEFATAVILHQPVDYVRAAVVDMLRFGAPNFGRERGYTGAGWDELEIDRALDPASAEHNRGILTRWYAPWDARSGTMQLMARYQELTTIRPGIWLILMFATLLAPLLAPRGLRLRAALMTAGAFTLLLGATALNMHVARYALPALGLLLPATAVTLEAFARRVVASAEAEAEATADAAATWR